MRPHLSTRALGKTATRRGAVLMGLFGIPNQRAIQNGEGNHDPQNYGAPPAPGGHVLPI